MKLSAKNSISMLGKGLDDATMFNLDQRFKNPVTERDFRNRALFLLMSRTALRAAEVVRLKWSDLITLPEGINAFRVLVKGKRIHIVIPGAVTLQALKEYHGFLQSYTDHIFYSLPLRAKRNGRTKLTERGLQKVINSWNVTTCQGKLAHPHSMRHTAIQKVFDLAGSMAAQKLAGHSSPIITSKFYTRAYFSNIQILDWENPLPLQSGEST